MGVKEVPKSRLLDGKTYLFFSHTIKEQAYNRGLLQELVKRDIKMIDYETLTYPQGGRVSLQQKKHRAYGMEKGPLLHSFPCLKIEALMAPT